MRRRPDDPSRRDSRRPRRRAIALVLALAGLALAPRGVMAASETDPPPAAQIAVDVETRQILSERHADEPRYPASLAKLMTAYVAFEALAAREIDEDTPVEISRRAASQPPVKAWLQPGETRPFGEILRVAIVASSNDAAMAAAEAVSGSAAAFVARMNRAAAALGMRDTRFVNPHGLPNPGLPAPGQRTTARDIALLGLALLERFPERAALFRAREARLGGRRFSTTNPLFGRVAGAEGLKTGFTCRAGYSIAALVRRGDRQILAITLGAPSKDRRLALASGQIEAAFAVRPRDLAAGFGPHPPSPPLRAASVRPPAPEPGLGPHPPLASARALTRKPSAPRSAGACTPSARRGGGPSGWSVFLGAKAGRGWASKAVAQARTRGRQGGDAYIGRRRDGRWAAMLHGFSRAQAIKACRAIRRSGGYCLTMSPQARRIRHKLWR